MTSRTTARARSTGVPPRTGRRWTLPAAMLAAAVLACATATPAHALRVMTWNLLEYPNTNLAGRQPSFRTVMANIGADVLVAQELQSQAGVDSFQTNVLDVVEPGQWANSGFYLLQSSPTAEGGAIFYKPAKVSIAFTSTFTTSGPRAVLFTRVTPVGYTNINATFRVYSVHFKAGGPSTADSTTRRLEATDVRTKLNTVPAGTNFLVGGDTNIYGAYEGAYIRLTESQLDNDGRGTDPLNMPGTWHVNPSYAIYDTQCPCNTGCGPGQSGGGLDDRFDLFLSSSSMRDGQGVELLNAGYGAYGNDGQHFNDDVNGGGFNNVVGLTIASALKVASDHLPVLATVQLASKISAASALDFGSAIVGGTAQQTLNVTDSADPPADALDYSFASPSGFTAPAGPQSAAAGVTNPHTIGMSTATTGSKSGTLTITTDAPDSLTKTVLLSGRVLAHALASLDSAATVTETTADFGTHGAGAFDPQEVRVFDRGYTSLKAQLALTGAAITGGDGRFSISGGFSPITIGATAHTYDLLFDGTGATTDSTYDATLTFSTSDEPLPGAIPQSDLVVHLSARVSSSNTGVGGGLPSSVAFAAPRPNPVQGATTFAFDLPQSRHVAIDVFDLHGRRIARVVDAEVGAGRHEVSWSPRDASGRRLDAGLYFARFSSGGFTSTRRLAILP